MTLRKVNISILIVAVVIFLLVIHHNFLSLSDFLRRELSDPSPLGLQPIDFIPAAPQSLTDEGNDKEISVVIAASDERLGGAIAAMNSIYQHTRSNVVFHIVTLNDTVDHLRLLFDPVIFTPFCPHGWFWEGPVITGLCISDKTRRDLVPFTCPRCAVADLGLAPVATQDSTDASTDYIPDVFAGMWLRSTSLKNMRYRILDFDPRVLEGKVQVDPQKADTFKPLTFARFYLPNLVPHAEKVIYVDDDVIVQDDIVELYNTPLKPGHAAAFSDDCDSTSSKVAVRGAGNQYNYIGFLDYKKETIRKLAMKANTCSFNPGVFVANLTEWKLQNITKQLEKWMALNVVEELYSKTLAGSVTTPPLLIVFYKQHSSIDPMWNVRHLGSSAGKRYSLQFVKAAKLLHWNGHFKPWGRTASYAEVWEKWYVPDPTGKFNLIRRHSEAYEAK